MENNNRILPLFYKVDPTDVRYQKRSFKDAFTKHEQSGRHKNKVHKWRAAFEKVADFSGWNVQSYETIGELVKNITEYMYSKVQPIVINMGDFQASEAIRQAMNEVMIALKDDEVTVVGVYGMGGVGKTTMVKHVGEQAFRNEIFDHVIMAVISQSPDLRKIQGALADLLGVTLEEGTETGRAAGLRTEIMKRNKILIILDDIWEIIHLSRIGIPDYNHLQKCNSKVLLTTRRLHVCHTMNSQVNIPLSVLSEEDSWTLFVKNGRRSFESTHFYDVARKVARECAGLPAALIAVARALGDKDLVEWEKAARRLEMSQTAKLDDVEGVFNCIKLSYDYLKDEDSKLFFLLCSQFPEDHEIQIEDLFKCAIEKEMFRDAETVDEAKEKAESVVRYLINCSMLLDGKQKGCVRMHDVVRDVAMRIALSEDGNADERYSAISLRENKFPKLDFIATGE